MSSIPIVKIELAGHVDDLYTLSLLFPEGAYPDLHVVTEIIGEKYQIFDRVVNADRRQTYLTGVGCLPAVNAGGIDDIFYIASNLLAPLNGYAVLLDSNYRPVTPISILWKSDKAQGGAVFRVSETNIPTRLITVRRHSCLREMLPSRVGYMFNNPLAIHAAAIIAGPPSWADYYRILEDIAGRCSTTLSKLDVAGLAEREALNAFKMAANNATFGRHGSSKRNTAIPQSELMNLLEAREFMRTVVTRWLDLECGGSMPLDRVDGPSLRFVLDGSEVKDC